MRSELRHVYLGMGSQSGLVGICSLANKCGSNECNATIFTKPQNGSHLILGSYLKKLVSHQIPRCTDLDVTTCPSFKAETRAGAEGETSLPIWPLKLSICLYHPKRPSVCQMYLNQKGNKHGFKSGRKKTLPTKNHQAQRFYRHILPTLKQQIIIIRHTLPK